MPTFSTKIAMAQKNKLTNRKTPVMVNAMSTTLAKKKTVEKFAKEKTAKKLVDVLQFHGKLQFHGEQYHVIPEREYRGLLATMEIMSDPEAYQNVMASFSDPKKKIFNSIDELASDLDSDDEWE
jgi:hypothetical protein